MEVIKINQNGGERQLKFKDEELKDFCNDMEYDFFENGTILDEEIKNL